MCVFANKSEHVHKYSPAACRFRALGGCAAGTVTLFLSWREGIVFLFDITSTSFSPYYFYTNDQKSEERFFYF